MKKPGPLPSSEKAKTIYAGLIMLIIGIGFILSRLFHNNDISIGAIVLSGILVVILGFQLKSNLWKIFGTVFLGVLIGYYFGFVKMSESPWETKVGLLLFCFAFVWLLLPIILNQRDGQFEIWPLVPAGLLMPTSLIFLYGSLQYYEFILAGCCGAGIVLLGWGLYKKLFGLIIAGSLLCSAGPSIYYAWEGIGLDLPLAQTGYMLVGFALGWFMIAMLSRFIFSTIVWWPLIPAGILTFVGWGLILSTNMNDSASVLGNSGSLVIILVGLYLLLFRKDIHK